jgi:hypothetical protein
VAFETALERMQSVTGQVHPVLPAAVGVRAAAGGKGFRLFQTNAERPRHLEQKPRRLHVKATARLAPQASHTQPLFTPRREGGVISIGHAVLIHRDQPIVVGSARFQILQVVHDSAHCGL